ncbi:hypothetical protein QJS10_CPA02g00087 [Acorus calamus]|uniref:Uncharacterized protein n=1 Tax=Acorus calamus TaxID=4465 RepID=A0AAV9FDJ9_ACOCL|nr:hypothetical protein QJS10_CPA02g00087 [Acorus calamus]
MRSLKGKGRAKKKPYVKMDKSSSVKVEIKSKKAKKLINQTLQVADRPDKDHSRPSDQNQIVHNPREIDKNPQNVRP